MDHFAAHLVPTPQRLWPGQAAPCGKAAFPATQARTPLCQVGRYRRKHIASVKSRAHVGPPEFRSIQRKDVRCVHAGHNTGEHTVVRARTVPCSVSTRMAARALPTPGSTTATWIASGGKCGSRRLQRKRPRANVVRRDVVRDVNQGCVRRQALELRPSSRPRSRPPCQSQW